MRVRKPDKNRKREKNILESKSLGKGGVIMEALEVVVIAAIIALAVGYFTNVIKNDVEKLAERNYKRKKEDNCSEE